MHRGRRSIIKEKITIWESGGGGGAGGEENQLKLGEIGDNLRSRPMMKKYIIIPIEYHSLVKFFF